MAGTRLLLVKDDPELTAMLFGFLVEEGYDVESDGTASRPHWG
jgi:DNA-binding response OmpR family regulator